MADPGDAVLEARDLACLRGDRVVFAGLDLALQAGSALVLSGANGAGKSTTLRAICGLVKPTEGHIYLGDEKMDLTKMKSMDIVKAGVAMIPEGRRVFGGLTVRENLDMGAWNRTDKAGIEDDIEACYSVFPVLKERHNQKAVTLSGGEQQMLSVSRSIMSKPRLLLMDEPSLGLAPLLVAHLFETIKSIHGERNMTILLVEQNMRAAIKIADYGYVLETGNIVIQGSAEELANNKKVQEAYIG